MLYRSLLDPTSPADADLDTAAMAVAEADVERGDRHLRVLARLTDIAMNLAEALGRQAEARIEATIQSGASPAPGDDPAVAAFEKMAQTVRRTIALEAKLAAGVKIRHDSLVAERAGRRAVGDTIHDAAKSEAILYGFHDAYAGSVPDTDYQEQVERLMEDAEEYLGEADEMRGYLDRPVGETVARLCVALGLDPDACAPDGDAWRVRRPPTEFELTCEKLRNKVPDLPPPCGEGQIAERSEWGAAGKPRASDAAAEPSSECSAPLPSP